MNTFSTFLEMGGYASYVWPCYILSAAVLIGIAAISLRSLRAARASLAALETEEAERS